jgi:AcrR family transcriptional regulator
VSTRERILDAARQAAADHGWSGVTMAAVGGGAGVSRQSVYNEFGGKAQLAEALVAREVSRFLDAVDVQIRAGTDPADAVQRASTVVFDLAAVNPVLRAALGAAAGSPSELLPLLTTGAQPLVDAAADRVVQALSDRFEDLPEPTDLRVAVDALVRVVLSHVVQPGPPESVGMDYVARRLLAAEGAPP